MINFFAKTLITGLVFIHIVACQNANEKTIPSKEAEAIQLLDVGSEPHVIKHNGYYYYTQGAEDKIIVWKTADLKNLRNAEKKVVWIPKDKSNAFHLWGPELHYIQGKWYIYFAADDGNMDNHQLYVIANESTDPLEGNFALKGRISTDKNNNWAIHGNILQHQNELYLIWSGWEERRIDKETQHIYIAKMKNPWELASERVKISTPEYEWERQWINPDGTKTSYPIYVNEAPFAFTSPDKDKIFIAYSASGNWTPYHSVGLLYADSKANLLDSTSWQKSVEPLFKSNETDSIFGTGTLSILAEEKKEEYHFLYHARTKPNEEPGAIDSRSPRMQKLEWTKDGFPVFGKALPYRQEYKSAN